jgi:photosystem II stability/assembly factor-like uncharacterized protein
MHLVTALLLLIFASCQKKIESVKFTETKSNTKSSLRGVSTVDANVAWFSGSRGNVGKTTDGGKTWQVDTVPNGQKLDFRDIEAFSADLAYIMSAGPGRASTIQKTVDGGKTWTVQLQNTDTNAFFNAIEFWDENNGICISDPLDGKHYLLRTSNGGSTWERIDPAKLPKMIDGEYGFAASGTNMIVQGNSHVWIGTGGKAARVFRSADRGETWTVVNTEMMQGKASTGIFSLAFRDENVGIAVGGDYSKADSVTVNALVSVNSGNNWQAYKEHQPSGYRSCVRYAGQSLSALAVGRAGASYTNSDGKNWHELDLKNGYYALSLAPDGKTGFASGSQGRVAKVKINWR